jgi:hypothetical protein
MWGVGQHTLLGIVAGLCASGYTLLGILGIVVGYVAPRATHVTGYCSWFTRGLGQHTLLGIVVGYERLWVPARDFLLETPWRIIIPNPNVNSHSL